MGKYRVRIERQARVHLEMHRKSGNKSAIAKIATIFRELEEHPYTGTGQPEQLIPILSTKRPKGLFVVRSGYAVRAVI